jgi:AraC-like DNA-binding protein
MRGKFSEVRGSAHDLESWFRLLARDDLPPVQAMQEIRDPAAFAGRMRRSQLDRISTSLIEVRAGEHTLRRDHGLIAATPEPDYYIVLCQLAGTGTFTREDGRTAALGPGDFTITSLQTAYTLSFPGDGTVFWLRFPQGYMDVPPQVLKDVQARPLSSRDGFGRHLAPFVTAIAHDGDLLRGPSGGRLARNLIDLFTTGVAELLESGTTGRNGSLFLKVCDYITGNLDDPGLDASAIARATHISVRYLQALFQEQGTTMSDWIRERRLAGCRRDLADPALRDSSIAEIALRWGYADPAYFSRRFRAEYGETPREWRARAIAIPVPTQFGPARARTASTA